MATNNDTADQVEQAFKRNYEELTAAYLEKVTVTAGRSQANGVKVDVLDIAVACLLEHMARMELLVLAMAGRMQISDQDIINAAKE